MTEKEKYEYLVGICNSINAVKYTQKCVDDPMLFTLLERAEVAIHKLVGEVEKLQNGKEES